MATRKEKSKELAQKRRTSYKGIMDELAQVLPFHKDVVSQLDYNSRLRLSLCFFRLKALMGSGKEEPADEIVLPGGMSEASGVDTQAQSSGGGSSSSEVSLFQPGILQNMMTEALDGFLMVISSDGNIVYLSESIHHHLGIFQSEHIGVNAFDIINTDDHETVKECVSDAVVRAMSFRGSQVEFFCHMKCSRFKVATTATTTAPGFKLVHVSGTMKAVNNSCYLLTLVRPVYPSPILEIGMEGNMFVTHYNMEIKCIYFDGRLEPLLGYKKEDLVGQYAYNLLHHNDISIIEQCVKDLIRRGQAVSGYFRFLSKRGFYVWLKTWGTVLKDSHTGKPYLKGSSHIVSLEKGERTLSLRHAVTTSGSGIAKDSSHHVRHDPYPVVACVEGASASHQEHFTSSPASTSRTKPESEKKQKPLPVSTHPWGPLSEGNRPSVEEGLSDPVSIPLAPWGSLDRRSMEEESLLSPHEHQPVFSPECAPAPQPHGLSTEHTSPHIFDIESPHLVASGPASSKHPSISHSASSSEPGHHMARSHSASSSHHHSMSSSKLEHHTAGSHSESSSELEYHMARSHPSSSSEPGLHFSLKEQSLKERPVSGLGSHPDAETTCPHHQDQLPQDQSDEFDQPHHQALILGAGPEGKESGIDDDGDDDDDDDDDCSATLSKEDLQMLDYVEHLH